MLDHEQGVSASLQGAQHLEQDPVVARMQADGGFVQDVADALQRRSQLGGEADPLGFAAG